MVLLEWTATMVKGPERLGFTSCFLGTGFPDVRIEEERMRRKERKLSGDIICSRMGNPDGGNSTV